MTLYTVTLMDGGYGAHQDPRVIVFSADVAMTQQAADYTLALADAGTVVEGTKGTAQIVTVPPNSSIPFPVGTAIEVVQMGVGQITITPGGGVTLRTPATLTSRAQYSSVSLRKRAADEWVVGGDLT